MQRKINSNLLCLACKLMKSVFLALKVEQGHVQPRRPESCHPKSETSKKYILNLNHNTGLLITSFYPQ